MVSYLCRFVLVLIAVVTNDYAILDKVEISVIGILQQITAQSPTASVEL